MGSALFLGHQHDGRGGQGDEHAPDDGLVPRVAEQADEAGHDRDGPRELKSATQQDGAPAAAQSGEVELEPDGEQQEDDPEFRERREVVGVHDEVESGGTFAEEWHDLLEQVGLEAIAEQPFSDRL